MNFLVKEGVVDASPMASLKPPRVPSDQIPLFTDAQVTHCLAAAKQSRYPKRDYALIRCPFDTDTHAGEVCALRMSDLNLLEGRGHSIKFPTIPEE